MAETDYNKKQEKLVKKKEYWLTCPHCRKEIRQKDVMWKYVKLFCCKRQMPCPTCGNALRLTKLSWLLNTIYPYFLYTAFICMFFETKLGELYGIFLLCGFILFGLSWRSTKFESLNSGQNKGESNL